MDNLCDNIYLDHATTSMPKAPEVVKEMVRVLKYVCASPVRSGHRLGHQASDLQMKVRTSIAKTFCLEKSGNVIFTSGATHALNLAIKGLLKSGDHIVTTCFEHNSVLRPLMRLQATGCKVTIVNTKIPDESLITAMIREFRPDTRLLVITHASNVSGAILPIEEIGRAAQERNILVLLDAAQTVGHIPIDLRTLPIDLIAFSGHKGLLGPPGIGCLLVKKVSTGLIPLLDGGTGFDTENLLPPIVYPISFEAGTQNLPAIAGLGASIKFVGGDAYESHRKKAADLATMLVEELKRCSHIHIHGRYSDLPSVPIISFTVDGMSSDQVANFLDQHYNIQCRAGLHCAPLMHKILGTLPYGTVRVALGFGNTTKSVVKLCEALAKLM